jgi:hypoxanthine-guanine phosphoribosyltransferase
MKTDAIIRLADLPRVAKQLVADLDQRNIAVGHVLFIETGGRLIGEEIAKLIRCPASGVMSVRRGSVLKRLLKPLVNRLPTSLTHELRRIELKSGVHNRVTERNVSLPSPIPDFHGALLIVDDAVDTGHSLHAVVDFLRNAGYAGRQIVTAAITVTATDVFFRPDLHLFSHLITFPWSPGSPDATEYARLSRL